MNWKRVEVEEDPITECDGQEPFFTWVGVLPTFTVVLPRRR